MNNAWALWASYETSFIGEVLCGCRLLEWLYLPTDCMMSRSIGAAKSGLRWTNMDRTTTARHRVSSSYSSRTAAQSRHLRHSIVVKPFRQWGDLSQKRHSCGLMHPPVRHCGWLLIDELLRRGDKHADCAGCREQAGLRWTCRGYIGTARFLEWVINYMLNKVFKKKNNSAFGLIWDKTVMLPDSVPGPNFKKLIRQD